ncbi:hypothetical protein ACW0JT_24420 [Arthrobacter sp. SA17]
MAIMMALMLVALTVTGAGTLTLLHSYLQGQVDDKLEAALDSARRQQSFNQLQEQNPSVPTDYSLILFSPGQQPFPFGGSKVSRPAIDDISPPRLTPARMSRSRYAGPTAAIGGLWPLMCWMETSATRW